jgi:hypothetical protein
LGSSRITFFVSLVAILVSILLYPIWITILNVDPPIQIKVASDTNAPLNMYVDQSNPSDSLPYARLLSKTVHDFQWKTSIVPQGIKNHDSKSSEISILSITTEEEKYFYIFSNKSKRVNLVKELDDNPGWLAREFSDPDQISRSVPSVYSLGDPSKPFMFTASEPYIKITLLKHPWSGKVTVNINDETYSFDLFDRKFSKQDIKLEVIGEREGENGTFLVNANGMSNKKLSFFKNQREKILPIEVSISGKVVSPDVNDDYLIPEQFLNKKKLALIGTFTSFIILSTLFSTFLHLFFDRSLFTRLSFKCGNQSIDSLIFIVTASITTSTFLMLTFYPASLSADASGIWVNAMTGDYNNWWPPLFTFLISGYQNLFGEQNFALFAFIQGLLFWFSILYLLRLVVRKNSNFSIFSVALILFPPLWSLSARILIDTWCTSFTLLSAAFLIEYVHSRNLSKLALMIFSLALTISTRHNAILLSIVPILTLNYLFFQNNKNLKKRILCSFLILIFTIAPSKIIDHLPQVKRINLLGIALFNQYIGTLSRASPHMEASNLDKERLETDAIFGDGKFKEVMSKYHCVSGDYIWVPSPPIIDRFELTKHTDFTVKKVFSTAIAHPISYLSHRLCNLSYILQIPALTLPYYNDILYPDLVGYPNSQIPIAKEWVEKILSSIVNRFDVIFRIWVFLLLSIPILIISFKVNDSTQIVLGAFNLIYFISYLIPDSAADWRYLMPNYILSIISLIGVVDKTIQKVNLLRS